MNVTEPGLDVVALTKAFDDRILLDGASFEVEPGEIVCLTGDNGAGKSTLLRCLVGLARFSGTATLGGESLGGGGTPLDRIGYLPQAPALLETATVEETIVMFASLRGIEPNTVEIADGFLPPLDARVGTLSGGQRQRVAITIAFLGSPKLLLLDEPTANLDDQGRLMVKDMARAAADRGASTIVVSPAAVDLVSLVDRILDLRGGKIVEGAPGAHLIRVAANGDRLDRSGPDLVEAIS